MKGFCSWVDAAKNGKPLPYSKMPIRMAIGWSGRAKDYVQLSDSG